MYHDGNIHFILPLSKQDHFYLFDDDEDEGECSSDEGSRSGSESNYSHSAGGSVPRERSMPLSTASSSRRDSTINEEPDEQNLKAMNTGFGSSKRSSVSTASSFEELSAAEAAKDDDN